MKKIALFLFVIALFFPMAASSKNSSYAVISLTDSVNPISAEYIVNAIKKAQTDNVQFVLLTIDTPGGLVGSMRDIIKEILTSTKPVVVYTYPKGAQAASAGGFIMLAGHVAAMSPGTEIGAMHPVSPFIDFDNVGDETKKQSTVMASKVLNDMVAYAKSISQKRGRNVQWTEKAVTQAISSTYKEALSLGVIDIIAEDIPDLLRQLDGRVVDVNGTKVKFSTKDVSRTDYAMSLKQKFMNFFADPQIVFFLFIIAVAGIIFEIKSPGLIIPGTVGVLALLLFLMAVRILPINAAGAILILLAIGLFILELNVTSYGLLTIAGIASFIIGSLILFDSDLPGFGISIMSIFAAVLVIIGIMFGIVRSVMKAHKGTVVTGSEGLIGLIGTAYSDISQTGKVKVRGELWNAKSGEPIKKNDPVEVVSVEGLTLTVKKCI
jgi:membrane-bound serine protease (ClpP class)